MQINVQRSLETSKFRGTWIFKAKIVDMNDGSNQFLSWRK